MDLLKQSTLADKKDQMVYKDESYAINGACMEVHRTLGRSFSEKVYQDALEEEFRLRNIPYEREKHFIISYKGKPLAHDYFADFVCYDKIIVELKAVSELDDANRDQVLNYIHAANLKLGLLINFRAKSIKPERYLNFDIE